MAETEPVMHPGAPAAWMKLARVHPQGDDLHPLHTASGQKGGDRRGGGDGQVHLAVYQAHVSEGQLPQQDLGDLAEQLVAQAQVGAREVAVVETDQPAARAPALAGTPAHQHGDPGEDVGAADLDHVRPE